LRKYIKKLREAAERTPAHRNRHVDLLRGLAISMVVLGHWLAMAVVHTEWGIGGYNLLGIIPWTHGLTWIFQVMPIFFFVGGYANAASLRSHYRRGGDAVAWILARTDRLLRPTTAFLGTIAAAALGASLLGVDAHMAGIAAHVASIPLWFLSVYFLVLFLTPLAYALHQRAGLLVPVTLVLLVGLLDSIRLALDMPAVATPNHLFVWLAIHQLGFAWRDGRWSLGKAALGALVIAAFCGLLALTVFGPYPVSLVNVPGQEIQNQAPPTFALLVYGLMLSGIAVLCSGASDRWLKHSRAWMAVIAINSVVLTIFLWHMTAAVVAAVALYPTGLMSQPVIGSGEWFLLRLPWLLVLMVILAAFVAAFGRIESRTVASSSGLTIRTDQMTDARLSGWQILIFLGVMAVVAGLILINLGDERTFGPAGLPSAGLIVYFLGAAILRLARSQLFSSTPP
jgi:fucose 4-O-acetylase-like acetyltransferase